MMTKKEIKQKVLSLEKITGIKCIHTSKLRYNAPIDMWREAWRLDRNWFRGFADTIYENT